VEEATGASDGGWSDTLSTCRCNCIKSAKVLTATPSSFTART